MNFFFSFLMLSALSLNSFAVVENEAQVKQALLESLLKMEISSCETMKGLETLAANKIGVWNSFYLPISNRYMTIEINEESNPTKVVYTSATNSYGTKTIVKYIYALSSDNMSVDSLEYLHQQEGSNVKNLGTITKPKYEPVPFVNVLNHYECQLQAKEIK